MKRDICSTLFIVPALLASLAAAGCATPGGGSGWMGVLGTAVDAAGTYYTNREQAEAARAGQQELIKWFNNTPR